MILAGHGDADFLLWDDKSNDTKLDPTDYENPAFYNLLRNLSIELVIFESCEAGAGGTNGKNQANRMAEHILAGSTVIAPFGYVYSESYKFDSSNSINNVVFFTRDSASGSANAAYYVNGKL